SRNVAFLRTISSANASPTLRSDKVLLRAPAGSDFAQWAMLREQSRRFLMPWEPVWPADDLTRLSFRRRLRRYQNDIRSGSAYPFFVFTPDGAKLLGGITMSQI